MSSPRRPVSPGVYRRRRIVLVLILALITAAVVVLILQPWRGTSAEGGPTPEASETQTPSTPPSPDPSASGSPSPSDTATASPTPTPTASPTPDPTESVEPIAACSSDMVDVVASVDQDSYAADENPQLSIGLTNTGDEACAINVGTAAQTFTITSGSDTWWRSTDCQENSNDQVVQLDAGQSVSTSEPLEWDKTRSAVDTCDGDRQEATAGTYHLSVSIGGIDSDQTASFRLE